MPLRLTGKTSDFLKIGVAAAGRGDLKTLTGIAKLKPEWFQRIGSHGRTMLWEASHRGKLEAVKFLVERNSNINAHGTHYTPYFVEVSCYCIAEFKRHKPVAKFLLDAGAKLNIHTAAFLGQTEEVKKYLARGNRQLHLGHPQHVMLPSGETHDFALAKTKWSTPLCYALRGGSVETVEYLIGEGAIIPGFDEQMFIAADDNVEMIRLLLENGADKRYAPRVVPDQSPLHRLLETWDIRMGQKELNDEFVYLCRGDRGGNPETVREMLRAGANVNHQDHKGKTALHRAAKAGFVETVRVLLEAGASVYIRDQNGKTPLFDAANSTIKNRDNLAAVNNLLVEAGADSNAENPKT